MDGYQLFYQGKPVDERRLGRKMTLGEYKIMPELALVLAKKGVVLDITNPKVTEIHIASQCIYQLYKKIIITLSQF